MRIQGVAHHDTATAFTPIPPTPGLHLALKVAPSLGDRARYLPDATHHSEVPATATNAGYRREGQPHRLLMFDPDYATAAPPLSLVRENAGRRRTTCAGEGGLQGRHLRCAGRGLRPKISRTLASRSAERLWWRNQESNDAWSQLSQKRLRLSYHSWPRNSSRAVAVAAQMIGVIPHLEDAVLSITQ